VQQFTHCDRKSRRHSLHSLEFVSHVQSRGNEFHSRNVGL
jgi:hypothetical protein